MRILLVSTYELGHQPVHLASPAAALRADGHEVRCLDTSVEPWDDEVAAWAQAVAFSVPMHTAMRLSVPRARALKRRRPDLPIAFYGLYAPVSRDHTVGTVADAVFAGTYEPALRAWAAGLHRDGAADRPPARVDESAPPGTAGPGELPLVSLARPRPELPARDLLPPLDRYARLAVDGEERLVGTVETTQGCLHTCRHCPVPTVYGGRFRAVPRSAVLADIAQLVEAGAQHINFADPDFLNGPTHALRLVTGMHERWPQLTFDVTTKVDHILGNTELWPSFADSGCLFVVSAFETLNDEVLLRLAKGHHARQAGEAIHLLRRHGIEVRPSWLPFTPWTRLEDVVHILDFVADHDLIANVEPVQYTIRLLVPQGSLLLDEPALQPHLGDYDPERLTYRWAAPDPRVDELQSTLAALVERAASRGASLTETFLDVNAEVRRAAGYRTVTPQIEVGATEGRPRLTEPWFC